MSRTRSPEEEQARYTWLTPAQVAERIGANASGAKDGGAAFVRGLVRAGEIGREGEVMDIGRGKHPVYVIHPRAVDRYIRESVDRIIRRRSAG